jgi:hypothetical protein
VTKKDQEKKEVKVQENEVVETKAKEKPKVITKTLKELGPVLPLGIESGGKMFHNFSVSKWTMKQEKELGELRTEHKEAGLGRYVSMVLATMCPNIGPHDFTKISFNESLVYISNLLMGNAYYVYCWLRYQSLGEKLGLKIDCPRCTHSFDFEADLETLDVRTAESLEAFCWEHVLHEPLEIRGKEIKGFKLGPARWNTTETSTDKVEGIGILKEGIIRGSIYGVLGEEDVPVVFGESELDEMCKRDIEAISRGIEDNYLGPDMSIKVRCDKCKSEIESQINWGYDNFFGISSR